MNGERFGLWTVIRICEKGEMRSFGVHAECRCDCGATSKVRVRALRLGESTGCHRCAVRMRHANKVLRKSHPLHTTWIDMVHRCTSPRAHDYHWYGGRGIRVCDEWRRDFFAFAEYMGPKPTPSHSLDRIDNDGHYEPGNVRWATPEEQAENRRTTVHLTVDGVTRTLREWADLVGITRDTIAKRVRAGWSHDRAVNQPPRVMKRSA